MSGFASNAFGFGNPSAGAGMPGFQEGFQENGQDLTTQGFTESLPGSGQTQANAYNQYSNMVFGGGPSIYQPNFSGNQQQPMTQSNGQLPPGFGSLSPIDRSQINPSAGIGMTGGPMTGGNLNDVNGNPLGDGFGTQMVTASPRPQNLTNVIRQPLNFGGSLFSGIGQALQDPANPGNLTTQQQQAANGLGQTMGAFGNMMTGMGGGKSGPSQMTFGAPRPAPMPAPRVAPRVAQTGIPASQARQVNAPGINQGIIPVAQNPFARLRRR
jgi:hypothetical protein